MQSRTTTTASTTRTARQQRRTIAHATGSGTAKEPRIKRTPTFTRDKDGEAIALVPLNKPGASAKVLAEDFLALQAQGFSDQWFLNDDGKGRQYVRVGLTSAPGRLVMVTRLLMNAAAGTRVKYWDGNRLNLRRDNLDVGKGYSKGHERAAIDERSATL